MNKDLTHVLSQYPADCQPSRIESLGSAGGLSGAQFWRLATPRGELMLRRWPSEHPSEATLRWIHPVLAHAARQGLSFLPVPVKTGDGWSFVSHDGHLWELGPWLPGAADYEPDRQPAKLRAALTALARFHVATSRFGEMGEGGGWKAEIRHGSSPGIARRLVRLRELESTGIDELVRAISDRPWPELAPLARRFVTLLTRAVPLTMNWLAPLADVPLALQPCLRDVWHDNVLFSGDEVTGLVDFGAMAIETSAGDVARLLGSMAGDDPDAWRIGLAAYTAVRSLTLDELQAVGALDASGTVLAGCNWVRWIYIDGRQFESRARVIERFHRSLARLERLVERGGSVAV